MVLYLTRICAVFIFTMSAQATLNPSQALQRRVPKQIHAKAAVADTEEDNNPAETHFGGEAAAGHHGHGKYFMDTIMIQTGPKQLEFGHVCENPHEWEQRYERQDQDKKRYQGKARWGDKHGGYGEHYWDYNHGGHHGDDGGSDDEGGDGSDPVPDYQPGGGDQDDRVKREHESATTIDYPTSFTLQGQKTSDTPVTFDLQGQKTSDTMDSASFEHPGLSLAYDTESGTVVDEATGRRFLLTPIN